MRFLSCLNMAHCHANFNDRTVRSVLTIPHFILYSVDRTVRSDRDRKRNWSTAMYLDREEGIGMRNRPGSRNAAIEAVEAKAPVDPEILRRWRHPETEPPAEKPEAEPRRNLPALIQARPGKSEDEP